MAAKPRAVLTVSAEAGLSEIWLWLAHEAGDATASRIVGEIMAAAARIAALPRMGKAYPELAPDVRGWVVRSHVAFYRVIDGGIAVLRVIHRARDLTAAWRERDPDA